MTALDDVDRWLRAIPDLCALLPDALITRPAGSGGPRPVPSSRPPVRLDIVSLLDERDTVLWETGMAYVDPDGAGVLPYLWGWCRDIEASLYEISPTLPPEVPAEPTVAGCCSWLIGALEDATSLPQWDELAWGIQQVHAGLRAATSAVRDVAEHPVPCSRCGGPLARVEGERPLWECDACGHLVTVQAVTLRQAAAILRREQGKGAPTLRTLQRWALRPGILAPVADGPRSRVFDLGQIRGLAAEAKLRDGA